MRVIKNDYIYTNIYTSITHLTSFFTSSRLSITCSGQLISAWCSVPKFTSQQHQVVALGMLKYAVAVQYHDGCRGQLVLVFVDQLPQLAGR